MKENPQPKLQVQASFESKGLNKRKPERIEMFQYRNKYQEQNKKEKVN